MTIHVDVAHSLIAAIGCLFILIGWNMTFKHNPDGLGFVLLALLGVFLSIVLGCVV